MEFEQRSLVDTVTYPVTDALKKVKIDSFARQQLQVAHQKNTRIVALPLKSSALEGRHDVLRRPVGECKPVRKLLHDVSAPACVNIGAGTACTKPT